MSTHSPEFGEITVDPAWKVAIVRAAWHGDLTSALALSCTQKLIELGIQRKNIQEIVVPGSFEIPLFCKEALKMGVDGVIAFGVVVQGDTHHARLIAEESASGCMQAQMEFCKPVIFEVLFVDEKKHAQERSIGKDGKGPLSAQTLLSCLAMQAQLHS